MGRRKMGSKLLDVSADYGQKSVHHAMHVAAHDAGPGRPFVLPLPHMQSASFLDGLEVGARLAILDITTGRLLIDVLERLVKYPPDQERPMRVYVDEIAAILTVKIPPPDDL